MQDCLPVQSTQGIGWIVLRSRDPAALAEYYKTTLGLPELRSWPGGHMLWAGQYAVLEINVLADDAPDQSVSAPCDVEMLPVLSAVSLNWLPDSESAVELTEKGEVFHCYRDPDGNWFAIKQEQRSSTNHYPTLPDVGLLPEPLLGLTGVLLRSAHPRRHLEFYANLFRDAVESQSDCLNINSGATLGFRKGKPSLYDPSDREQVQRVFIPRVFGFSGFVDQAELLQAKKLNELVFDGGMLNYYLDPEGQLFGFQERKPFDEAVPTSQAIEDKMSREAFEKAVDI